MDLEDTSFDLSDLSEALPATLSRSSSLVAPTLSELPVELKIKVVEHVYALPLGSEPDLHLSASPWTSVSKREKESLVRLDVGPEDLRSVGLIARVAHIIPLLPHLETLSLTAYEARILPVLQLSTHIHTLELVLQSGYPDPGFFVPFVPHLRTLFFSTNDFRHVVGPLYDLPRVTSLHLASPSHHDLSIFHRLPLAHSSFADWEYRSPLSTGEGLNIARIVEQHASTLKTLVFEVTEVLVGQGRDLRHVRRILEAIQLLCRERRVKAVLPTAGKDCSDWSEYDTEGLKLHRPDDSPNTSEYEMDVDMDEDESSEVSEDD